MISKKIFTQIAGCFGLLPLVVSAADIATFNKPYNEYTWVTSHNSHANSGEVSAPAINQWTDMYDQMKHRQVRGLMIDLRYEDGRVELTHDNDNAGEFIERMKKEVVRFLNEEPNAVLFFDIEVFQTLTKDQLKEAMDQLPDITNKMFDPNDTRWDNHDEWPTLQELIDANQRVIMVIQNEDVSGRYGEGEDSYVIMHRPKVTLENYWGVSEYNSCEERHGYNQPTIHIANKPWSRLFTMNHFGDIGNAQKAVKSNNWDNLYPRIIDTCIPATGLNVKPNFLAVDFVTVGDVQEIAEVLTEGGIIFYEGNNATQSIVCGLGVGKSRVVIHGNKGCENDETRSAKLVDVPSGTSVAVYDSPSGLGDDYAVIETKSQIGEEGYIISHFQQSYSSTKVKLSYFGDQIYQPNSNKLNGKVSRWEIDTPRAVAPGVVHQSWSPWRQESKSDFICPSGQILVGRQHVGDENGNTRYKCTTFKINGKDVVSGTRIRSQAIKESEHGGSDRFTCGINQVLVGRSHKGDENGLTYYLCENLKNQYLTDSGSHAWINAGSESSSQFTCDGGRIMVGRKHNGDERAATHYKCANVFKATQYTVCLKAYNGDYISSENDRLSINANRKACNSNERHGIYDENGGELENGDQVSILSPFGRYWSAHPNGNLVANSTYRGSHEAFTIYRVNGSGPLMASNARLAFKSVHNKWLVAEQGGGAKVKADRATRGAWETFILEDVSDIDAYPVSSAKVSGAPYPDLTTGTYVQAGYYGGFPYYRHTTHNGYILYRKQPKDIGGNTWVISAQGNPSANWDGIIQSHSGLRWPWSGQWNQATVVGKAPSKN